MKKHIGKGIISCVIMGVLAWTLWYGQIVKAGSNVEMSVASKISVGSSVSGTISTEGEEAWYKFTTSDKNSFYSITASTTTKEKDFSLDLVDEDGSSVDSIMFGTEESGSMCYKLNKKTTYYVQVCMNDIETSGRFQFKVTSILDDYEDTLETATLMTLGKDISGKFEVAEDRDYSLLSTPNQKLIYETTFTNLDVESGIDVAIVDSEDCSVESRTVEKGTTVTFSVKLEKNSQYYLCVLPSVSSETGNYKIRLTTTIDDAGDTIEEAMPIGLNVLNNGWIKPGTDEDYYVFNALGKEMYYTVTFGNKNIGGGLDAEILDSEGTTVENATAENGEEQTITLKLKSGENYYVHVNSSDWDSEGQYSIKINSISDDAGDNIEQAATVGLDTNFFGRFEVIGDTDYVKFTTSNKNNYYKISLSNQSVEEDVTMTVLDAEGNAVNDSSVSKGETTALQLKLERNKTYYISFSSVDAVGVYNYTIDTILDNAGDTMETADSIAINTQVKGCLETTEDVDYVKFTATKANTFYQIMVSNETVEDTLLVSLWSEDGIVDSTEIEKGKTDTILLKLEKNKNYYLAFESNNETGNYHYTVKAVADEGGDTLAEATPIKLEKLVSGSLQTDTDIDYFAFSTNCVTTEYTISATNISATEEEMVFTVLDSKGKTVATVKPAKGKTIVQTVTLVKNKKYYIHVTASGEVAQYSVKVGAKYVAPKTVKLNKKKVTLKRKKSVTLKVSATPSNAVIQKQTWTSSNRKIATVTKKGVVVAKKKGVATISCKVLFYGGKVKTVKCKVTIK